MPALDRQLAQKEAERDTIAATIAKLEATIPVLAQRVDIRKYLFEKELGSKLIYLTEYQDLVGLQQELLVQKSKYREADAAVAALVETRVQTEAEYRRARFEELAKAEQKAAGLAQDVIKAEQRTKLQVLTAPVDGVVQQLAVHTIGGVVTPARRSPWSCRSTVIWKSKRWCRTATSASCTRVRKPRSRSTPSVSPDTGYCTASAQRVAGRHHAR